MTPGRAPWRELYPFESHYATMGGQRLHYIDEGAGEPLLFVHGNPTWSFYWRNLILGLRGEYRTVAIDHMGCGLSDKPDDYEYTLERRIRDLVEFVKANDLRQITLVAHDWGGAIGLGALLRAPTRFSRIVLFNTGAFPPPFIPQRIRLCRTPVLGRVAVQGFNAFARAALSMATEKPERMTADVKAGLLAPYDSWDHRRAIYEFVADIPLSPKHASWQTLTNIETGLHTLGRLPTLLIWGMRDWCFTPACLERFRAAWPTAEVHELADCGHYVVEDAHERIVPLMQAFLKRDK